LLCHGIQLLQTGEEPSGWGERLKNNFNISNTKKSLNSCLFYDERAKIIKITTLKEGLKFLVWKLEKQVMAD
jgi:hypothetical protein